MAELPIELTVPEILDVLAEEVQPFDMVDEGLTVCTTTWHYQPSIVVMYVGIVRAEKDEDGLIYPAWSAMQERTYKQGETVRVIRGLPALEEPDLRAERADILKLIEGCNVIPPENGSTLQRYDGSTASSGGGSASE